MSEKLWSRFIPVEHFCFQFTRGKGPENEEIAKYDFSTHDLVTLAISTGVGVWYFMKKHWIANNLFGLAFAVNGVELLHLNSVMTGCTLLGGLFLYDIFWVFGTDVVSSTKAILDNNCGGVVANTIVILSPPEI